MGTIDIDERLTMQELCTAINALQAEHPIVAGTDSVSPRTVRFYIEKGLLDPVRSGPGKKYPAETVWRVLFIRLLQQQHAMELTDIARVLRKVKPATMQKVVEGVEPLEITRRFDPDQIRRHQAQGYEAVDVRGSRVLAREDEPANPAHYRWEPLVDTDAVKFVIRRDLRGRKRKQLAQVAGLVRAIIDEDDD